jgi:hypothetical protein
MIYSLFRFGCVLALATALEAQQADALKVSIIEGAGGVNSLKQKSGSPIVVEVRDETGRIVPAARVEFTTPASGPTGAVEGRHSFLAWTDSSGRARVVNLVPNGEGSFPVTVEARFAGKTGKATFDENNSQTAMIAFAYNKPSHKLRNTLIIAGVVGAAALAIGLTLALSGSTKAIPPTPTSVGIGTITVGGPQ